MFTTQFTFVFGERCQPARYAMIDLRLVVIPKAQLAAEIFSDDSGLSCLIVSETTNMASPRTVAI